MSATFFRFCAYGISDFSVIVCIVCILCDLCVFGVFFGSFIVFPVVLLRLWWYLMILRYFPARFLVWLRCCMCFLAFDGIFLLISGSFCMFFCDVRFCWYFSRVFSVWLYSCVLFSAFEGCFLVYSVVFVCFEFIWVFPDFLDTICRSCVVSDLGICL